MLQVRFLPSAAEKLSALSKVVYAYERPNADTFPEFTSFEAVLEEMGRFFHELYAESGILYGNRSCSAAYTGVQ
jgi:hypothetical protein